MRVQLIGLTSEAEFLITQSLAREPWLIGAANDLTDARKHLRLVDLICLEMHADASSTFSCIQRIRKLQPQARVLVLLHDDCAMKRANLIDHGADEVISLPVPQAELRARIVAITRR